MSRYEFASCLFSTRGVNTIDTIGGWGGLFSRTLKVSDCFEIGVQFLKLIN